MIMTPNLNSGSVFDAQKSNHRPSSVASYSKSSRLLSVSNSNQLNGGISPNQSTAMTSQILPPLIEVIIRMRGTITVSDRAIRMISMLAPK